MNRLDDSLALAESLIRYAMTRRPNSIQFAISQSNISVITLGIYFNEYRGLALLYGRPFVEQMIQYFEDREEYEACAFILRQLDDLRFELNYIPQMAGAQLQALLA
ncbi:hypothetical protein [Telluribacter sp. SYSU D00476]|uniref:hypothetical protein n=1 Tax=Telluribacter sp. SYSU D00476 TaxID=2811430 RepID=UPI001FF349B1|nr:hypothetical protein [Telluribacter sp. SYSU D00476]